MSFEIVTWKLVCRTPLMQNRLDSLGSEGEITKKGPTSPEDIRAEAAKKLHVTADGRFFHPSQAFWSAWADACVGVKIGSTSANTTLPPAVDIVEIETFLYDPTTLDKKEPRALGAKDWVVDSRPIQTSKGMIMSHRPRWNHWGALLLFEIDREVVPVKLDGVITKILNYAGRRGAGAGRLHKDTKNLSKWCGIGMGKFEAELLK